MRRSVLAGAIAAAAVAVAIGLSSPLFYDTAVDESLPSDSSIPADDMGLADFLEMSDLEQQAAAGRMSEDTIDAIMRDAANTTEEVSEEMDAGFSIHSTGTFEGLLGHHASGNARILSVSGSEYLRFENFEVTNGPDLRVYLTNNADIKTGLHLEKLKGNKGNQNYSLDGIAWKNYDTVVIYCQPFGVHFGQAGMSMTG